MRGCGTSRQDSVAKRRSANSVRCSCDPGMDVSFTDQMVRDVLIRGLNDLDIQQEVLGNENQDLDLEQTISLVEAKEAGRRSQASVIGEGAHAISQHKKKVGKTETIQDRKARCENVGNHSPDHWDLAAKYAHTRCASNASNKAQALQRMAPAWALI